MIKAIVPGTFDPFTNGHLNLITRAAKIFDKIVLSVSANPIKNPIFSIEERIEFARRSTMHIPNVIVKSFDKLISHFAKQQRINILIRGLREESDFSYEMKLVKINKQILPNLEIIFMMSNDPFSYISSSIIKEIALYGGEIDHFLPKKIAKQVYDRINYLNSKNKNV